MLRGLALDEAVRLASASGYGGICWEVPAESTLADLSGARSALDQAAVDVSCLAFEPDERNQVDPERAAEMADVLGARQLRICGASMAGHSYTEAYDATLRACAAYSQAARKRGIRVLLHQRWATVTASASQLYRVLSNFDPSAVGCIYDAGSMAVEGYEEYRIGLEVLGNYVADVHIANARHFPANQGTVWDWEWSPLSDGLMDLQRLFRALRRGDYRGWVTLADRTQGHAPSALLTADRHMLQQAMDDMEGVGSHNPCRPLDDHVDVDQRPERAGRQATASRARR
jgi:sugar phosphate isomerase/epimerase